MKRQCSVSVLLVVIVFAFTIHITNAREERNASQRLPEGSAGLFRLAKAVRVFNGSYTDMAADCALEPTGEDYIGVRYKALLAEDELSETGWVLSFAGSGFTTGGEYQPHFMDLMIKAGWASLYDDPVCSSGFPPVRDTWDNFAMQFGLSDYEDAQPGQLHDNDIAAWTRDPQLFPRMYTNIDSRDPQAPDKIMAEYQVDKGGRLEGKVVEVSLTREEVTRLSPEENYFMDPDLTGGLLCSPSSQDDILYRHWVATLRVPDLGIDSSVDFYLNASQGDKINGSNTLNFMWENPGKPAVQSDKYKVIIFDPEVRLTSGEWVSATRFLVDLRTPEQELPYDEERTLIGGFRKVNYLGRPAIEASFGYGYTDYVIDGDPTRYEPTNATKAVIDLRYPTANTPPNRPSVPGPADDATNQSINVDLFWSGGDPDGDSVTYDVYFEANDSTPDSLIRNDTASTSCDPGTLNYSTHYYWQVIATDEHGSPTTGLVWDFTTRSSAPPVHNAVYLPMLFQGRAGTAEKVLFDEAHSVWTSIEGNYREFADGLRAQGYIVDPLTVAPVTAQTLGDYDVYVIGTAWGDFSHTEVDAIQQFVQSGGGLFLTGLGWSWVNPDEGRTLDNYPMNVIGSRFGIRFLDGSVRDPTDYFGTSSATPIFHQFANHSIAQGLSQVGGPISAAPLWTTQAGAVHVVFGDADAYSSGGEYPPGTRPPIAVAVTSGLGRVAALGHEAYLSTDDYSGSGGAHIDLFDNAKMGLNIMAWLSQ